MDAADTKAPIYDFLYRDPSRIASFYAQLFGGHLLSTERSNTTRSATESVGGGSVYVFKGERKTVRDASEGGKEIHAPHDLITADLISRLVDESRFATDPANAPNGSLIHIHGDVSFADATALKTFAGMDDDVWYEIMRDEGTSSKMVKSMGKAVKSLFVNLNVPSVFTLRSPTTHLYLGTIKDSGLEEPIAAFYYKHGSDSLPNGHVVGIKEVSSPIPIFGGKNLIGASRQFANALRNLIFPEGAIRVTPLVIFRKI